MGLAARFSAIARKTEGCSVDINYIHRKPVLIEDGAFIGTGTIILKGTHIGRGSIIGAGSIVSGEIPPFEIWAGVPAKYVKKIE